MKPKEHHFLYSLTHTTLPAQAVPLFLSANTNLAGCGATRCGAVLEGAEEEFREADRNNIPWSDAQTLHWSPLVTRRDACVGHTTQIHTHCTDMSGR